MPLTPGQRLAAYEIVSSLGAGGMGEVYRARDTRLGRDVALKVLPPDLTAEADRLERFDREARVIAALNHPHIVTIYSTEESNGIRFLTMELVDGCTLSDLVVSSGMAVPKFLEIAIPFADALAAAHQKHITHRDLKPGNVMVSHDGRVKVLDFGLARVGGGAAGEESLIATRAPITHQGMIVGTMPYMSPEQVEGRSLDPRSDLFSLGVIFYELLSGERPFKGASSPALMSAILRDSPRRIGERRADIPESLERLVDRLLEKRPEDRVQTARDVYNELRHVRRALESGSSGTQRVLTQSGARSRANLTVTVQSFDARAGDDLSRDLADGLREEIANGLSRFAYLSVRADDNADASRFVINGQIRKAGQSIRVSVKLMDVQSRVTVWAENYDRQAGDDLFAIQDAIANRVVTTIGDPTGVLARTMLSSIASEPAEHLSIAELTLRFYAYNERLNAVEHAQLREAFERALEREPTAAEGWACLSQLYRHEYSQDLNPLPEPLERQRRAAGRAVELDANSQMAWVSLASAHLFARDKAGVHLAVDRAVELNPLNAVALTMCAQYLSAAGDHDHAVTLADRAIALKPQRPGWLHMPAFGYHFVRGQYEEALREAKGINLPKFAHGAIAEAAAAGMLGKVEEARTALRAIEEHNPHCLDPQHARVVLAKWIWDEQYVDSLIEGYRRALTLSGTTSAPKPPSSTSGAARATSALTVAVMPFVPRSSDAESKAMADGLTDDITRGLSRFGYLKVLSRSAVERASIRSRYAIEGHVRRAGSAVRIGITLVDTSTATNLWTESYDRNIESGVFTIQDDVASVAAATIGDQSGVLMRSMAASIVDVPFDQLSVAELVIRYHIYAENYGSDEHALLRTAFEAALVREPRAAEGWACLAMLCEHEYGFGFNPLPNTLRRHRDAAERAIALDARSQHGWSAMATVHLFARDVAGVRASVDRVVALNPLNADLVARVSLFLGLAGDHDAAFSLIRSAIALKPQHPTFYHFVPFNYYYARGEDERAMAAAKQMAMPRLPVAQLSAAVAAGQLGRSAEARTALAALRTIDASLTTVDGAYDVWKRWIADGPFLDRLLEGFTKAVSLDREASGGVKPPSSAARKTGLHTVDQSIAVLPFTDLSEKKDQDWFCDGIAEEIMNALAALPGLRVAARASAFSFRGKADDLEAIADKLDVATVLEGSVRRSGDRVRITTQLSDAQQDKVLWSERFDRELKDIFDVQEEIARAIAERLRISIAGDDERIVPKATTNIEAYQLLLKGREFVTRRGRAVLDAIPLFERAIALDPNLSEAHALLGDAYRLLGLYGVARASEVMPKARACIDRALAINPANAEALATLAIIATIHEWNIGEVRRRSDRALAADPSHVRANAERGISVAVLGQPGGDWHEEARSHLRRARELDPLNPWVVAIQAGCMMFTGDLDAAVDLAKHAIDLDAGNFTAHWLRVNTLAEVGRLDESLAASEPALALSGRHTMILTNMTAIYAERGETNRIVEIHNELRERAKKSFIGNGALACVAAAAGEWAEARDRLAEAIAERDPWVAFWKMYAWRPVWKDEQCAEMYRATPLFSFLRS